METLIPYDAKLLGEHRARAAKLFAKHARETKSWGKFSERATAKEVLAAEPALLLSLLVVANAKITTGEKHTDREWNAGWELTNELPRHVKAATPADAVLLLALGSASGLTRYGDHLIKPGLMVAEKALKKFPDDDTIHAAARKLVSKIDKYTKRQVAAKLRALAAIKKKPTVVRAATTQAKSSDLPKAFAKVARAKLPKWWHPDELSRVVTQRGAALDDAAMDTLASALVIENEAALAAAREGFDARSLAVFAWDLYAAWMDAGSDMKHKWALAALGHFGDDETATKLASLVTEWAVDYSARAAFALVALRRMAERGSDAALGALQSASMTGRTWTLKARAKAALAELAKARGVDPEELAVPRFGLGPDGTRELVLGGRKYRASFDATLRPVLRDASGKVVSKVPKPKGGEPDEWSTLVRGVRKIASAQVLRLERAMRDRIAWRARVFEASFAKHPLMTHAARGLVWAVDGTKKTFRIAEDGTYADEHDRAFTLPAKADVLVAHPADLAPETLARWRSLFESYALIQPFQQLGRVVYALEPAERKSKALERFRGVPTTVGRVIALERRGWELDSDEDAIDWLTRRLRPDLLAVIELDPGLNVRLRSASPPQKIAEVRVAGKKGTSAKLGVLTPVEASELILDVESLR